MPLFRTHKQRPAFLQLAHEPKAFPRFIPVPAPNPSIARCRSPLFLEAIKLMLSKQADIIVFHTVGDTGPESNGPDAQDAVAEAMEAQFTFCLSANTVPALFLSSWRYDLLQRTQLSLFDSQFYEPYKYYQPVIFAIPGNHDGDTQVRSR